MEILTRVDYYNIGRRYVIARARSIDPAVIDVEGSDANIAVASSSYMAQKVGQQLADGLRSLTLDAEGDQLDRTVMDRYQLPRKGAASAVVPVRFFRPTAAAGAGTVPVGTTMTALAGAQYITLAPASFGALVTDDVVVAARAVQAGFQYQVGANQIRRIQNPGNLWDSSLQVNNDEPAAGGAPREEDPQYRERARAFWLAARRGTIPAIVQGATNVLGVDSASAVESLDPLGRPARVVTLTIADASGNSNRVLAAQVLQQLEDYRAGGITVIISSSVPQIIGVTLSLTFIANVDTNTLTGNIRSAIAEFVNSLGANMVLRRGDLFSVLSRFRDSGLVVTDGSIALPTGDLVPDPGKTLRTQFELVTVV